MKRTQWTGWAVLAVLTALFFVLVANDAWWEAALSALFPDESQVLLQRATLLTLVLQHLELVAISSALTIIVAVPLGIWVTRPAGRPFLSIATTVTNFGQVFPPVAVLALAVPLLGFGLVPTVVALFLYGLLPVVRNTIAGIGAVSPSLVDAAHGLGMSRWQALVKGELPLSARVIIAGIRISVIINIGTAMIGAVIGAGGLGSPIVAGRVQNNTAFILEGAIPAAMLAILADQWIGRAEGQLVTP